LKQICALELSDNQYEHVVDGPSLRKILFFISLAHVASAGLLSYKRYLAYRLLSPGRAREIHIAKTIMCIGEHIVKEWIMSMLALTRWFKAHRNAADFDKRFIQHA